MKQMLLVGFGGFLGTIARFQLGKWLTAYTATARFPWSTFSINLIGCLTIGLLAGLVEKRDLFSSDVKPFLFIGVLGGFTTFSAFGYEAVNLLRRSEPTMAALYVSLSVLCGLTAVWLGMRLSGPTSI